MLGDRLGVAAIERDRVETFTIEAENPGAALRAELDARSLAARTVAIGLSRSTVTVKPIELPAVAGATHDMVKFELERHLPIPADDAAFDFVPLPPEAEVETVPGEGTRVLIAAADRRLIDGALRLAEEAKLRPVSITVAAHDLLALVDTDRRQRIAWLHRIGDTGRAALAARARWSCSAEASPPPTTRRSSPRPGAASPARGGAPATRSGFRATPPPPRPSSTSASRFPSRRGRRGPSVAWPRSPSRAAPSSSRWRPPRTAASASLDLIPPAIKPRRFTRPEMLTAGALVATLVLALAALLVPGFVESRRLARLNGEIARIDPDVRTVERVARELDHKRQLVATVEKINSSSVPPLAVLRELTEILPSDAWVTYLAFDAKGVEMTGQAARGEQLDPAARELSAARARRVRVARHAGPGPRAVQDPRRVGGALGTGGRGGARSSASRADALRPTGAAQNPRPRRLSDIRAAVTSPRRSPSGAAPAAGRKYRSNDRQPLASRAGPGRPGAGRRRHPGRVAAGGRADPRAQSVRRRARAGARAGAASRSAS